ncbi:phosphopantetheine-binding protein [Escherichia coli]
MQALPDVEQAVTHACVINQAAATGGDARQLVGYLVSQSGLPLDTSALQAQLRETLPPHMVPVVLLQLPQLPLSANGKLDCKALPLPELKTQASGRAPKAGSETIIAAAFASSLGCDVQDADADFFALGGHSLLAMKLAAQLVDSLPSGDAGQVMVASTVAKLATIIDGEEDSSRRMGFETICRCVKVMADAVLFPSGVRFCPGSLACSRVISIHNGRLLAFSRRALMDPCRTATNPG